MPSGKCHCLNQCWPIRCRHMTSLGHDILSSNILIFWSASVRDSELWSLTEWGSIVPETLSSHFPPYSVMEQQKSITSKYHNPSFLPLWHSSHSLQWHQNGFNGVSNHQPHDCLRNHSFRRRSKKTSKLCVTGFLCAGNSLVTGELSAQMASYAENVSICDPSCNH